MKKILWYGLGVLSSFNTAVVHAVEKFEILPDLPAPLSYAGQSAQAATVSGSTDVAILGAQTIGHEPSIISVVLSLVFVILLIYVTGILYAKLNKVGLKTMRSQQGDFARSQVSVISTTQLGNNKTLHVVELDGKRMLIGASSGAIQLIKDLGNFQDNVTDEEYSHIEIPNIQIPKIEIPKIEIPFINFSKLATKTHKSIDEVENNDLKSENIVEQDKVKSSEISESSDVIIDSLFTQQNILEGNEVDSEEKSEHIVDPEDYALYKKYLN